LDFSGFKEFDNSSTERKKSGNDIFEYDPLPMPSRDRTPNYSRG
jgi:hypothetical protein